MFSFAYPRSETERQKSIRRQSHRRQRPQETAEDQDERFSVFL